MNNIFDELSSKCIYIKEKLFFIASDITNTLGYSRTSGAKAISKYVDKKHIVKRKIKTKGGMQYCNLIDLEGLNQLLLKTDMEIAKCFSDWISETVCPSVWNKGGYIIGQEEENEERQKEIAESLKPLYDPDTYNFCKKKGIPYTVGGHMLPEGNQNPINRFFLEAYQRQEKNLNMLSEPDNVREGILSNGKTLSYDADNNAITIE